MYETKKSAADIFNNDINNLRKLSVNIGKDKNGEVVTIKYFENPQLLVTGSDDKRQTELINTMLAGVILKTNPDDVKLIVIDEMNELDRFNGLPHLLWPVITDTKKALETLKWVRDEKNQRDVNMMCFEEPDIMGYNALAAKKVPFIVLVINGMKKLLQKNESELKEIMSSFLWEPNGNCGIHLTIALHQAPEKFFYGIVREYLECTPDYMPPRLAIDYHIREDGCNYLGMGDVIEQSKCCDTLYYPVESKHNPIQMAELFNSEEALNRGIDLMQKQNNHISQENALARMHKTPCISVKKEEKNVEQLKAQELYKRACSYEQTSENMKTIIELYHKAAEMGCKQAMSKLGDLYYEGKAVPQDYAKAFEMYSEVHSLYTSIRTANMYHYGLGVEKNYNKALEIYCDTIVTGFCEESMYQLGLMYERGEGVERNIEAAVHVLKKLCCASYARTCYHLGMLYYY